jgi:hypothetical protein
MANKRTLSPFRRWPVAPVVSKRGRGSENAKQFMTQERIEVHRTEMGRLILSAQPAHAAPEMSSSKMDISPPAMMGRPPIGG